MPEYLTPGVYVEEVSFRRHPSKGLEPAPPGFAASPYRVQPALPGIADQLRRLSKYLRQL